MKQLMWVLIFAFFSSVMSAAANECRWGQPPTIIFEAPHELHQYWTIDDAPIYGAPSVTDDFAFLEFRSEIAKRVPDLDPFSILQREYNDFIRSGDPVFVSEAALTRFVLEKKAGSIRPIHCLESLLLSVQLKRQSMIDQPSEFGAFLMRKGDAAQMQLRIYFSTWDKPGGKIDSKVWDRIERDLADGWILERHLHNHNFMFQDPVSVMGGVCPSRPDLRMYIDLVHAHGLQAASVTNGLSTIDLTVADILSLTTQ